MEDKLRYKSLNLLCLLNEFANQKKLLVSYKQKVRVSNLGRVKSDAA